MRDAAIRRGITLTHRARPVTKDDLREFDLILVMDEENLTNVLSLDPEREFADKVKRFCEFCTKHDETEVPDPYYGGTDGFDLVLDLLEDGCDELVRRIQKGTLSSA